MPGKLVAFPGPQDLGGASYADDGASRTRRFAPAYLAAALGELGVSDVVRLGEGGAPQYDAGAFEEAGIRHHDLCLEGRAEPPGPLVAAFLAIVDGARAAVAMHCGAGRGRAGTLIAV